MIEEAVGGKPAHVYIYEGPSETRDCYLSRKNLSTRNSEAMYGASMAVARLRSLSNAFMMYRGVRRPCSPEVDIHGRSRARGFSWRSKWDRGSFLFLLCGAKDIHHMACRFGFQAIILGSSFLY